MFATRLKQARKAAGLSMSALAEKVGISANAIKKYEHGINMPSSGNLIELARALGVRSEYFFRPIKIKLEGVEYRKHADTPKNLLEQINGDVIDQAERWIELLNLYPNSVKPVPRIRNTNNKRNHSTEVPIFHKNKYKNWNKTLENIFKFWVSYTPLSHSKLPLVSMERVCFKLRFPTQTEIHNMILVT